MLRVHLCAVASTQCVFVSLFACVGLGCNENRTLAKALADAVSISSTLSREGGSGARGLIQALTISDGEMDWREKDKRIKIHTVPCVSLKSL